LALLHVGRLFHSFYGNLRFSPSLCAILDYFLLRCQPSLIIYLQITFPVWREEFPLP